MCEVRTCTAEVHCHSDGTQPPHSSCHRRLSALSVRREGGETRILIKVFHQHAHLFQYFRRLSHGPDRLTAISDHLIFPRETTLLSASHQHLSATNCASNCLFCARGSRCPPLRWDCVRRTRWAAPSRRPLHPTQIWNGPRRTAQLETCEGFWRVGINSVLESSANASQPKKRD